MPTAPPAQPITNSNPILQPTPVSSLVYNDIVETIGATVPETTFDLENMEDVLFFRYGLLPTQLSCAPITSPNNLLPWPTIRLILGDHRATPDKSFCEAVAHFVHCALDLASDEKSTVEQSKDVLRHICDLHDELRDSLKQDPTTVCVRPIQFTDNVVRYLLQPDIPSDWFVVLDSALSAMECLRRPKRKLENIVTRLTQQGIPF
jgi:hypothetical protein